MDVWRYYQPNPKKRNTGDCSVRAISKALGVDWETAYILTADAGLILADMPDNNSVIGGLLQSNGFRSDLRSGSCKKRNCHFFLCVYKNLFFKRRNINQKRNYLTS